MALFVIGDPHLALSLEKPMDIFGSRWVGYVDKLRTGWTARVSPADTVVLAGDISWAMTLDEVRADFDFIESLPGEKIILKGNHDYWWQTMAKLNDFVLQNGYKTIRFLHNNAYEAEEFILCGTRGWYTDERTSPLEGADAGKIVARETQRLGMSLSAGKALCDAARARGQEKEMLAFFHFPPVFGDYVCEELVKELSGSGIARCFAGHIHGKYDAPACVRYANLDFYLVSADYLKFEPMKIEPKNQILPKSGV